MTEIIFVTGPENRITVENENFFSSSSSLNSINDYECTDSDILRPVRTNSDYCLPLPGSTHSRLPNMDEDYSSNIIEDDLTVSSEHLTTKSIRLSIRCTSKGWIFNDILERLAREDVCSTCNKALRISDFMVVDSEDYSKSSTWTCARCFPFQEINPATVSCSESKAGYIYISKSESDLIDSNGRHSTIGPDYEQCNLLVISKSAASSGRHPNTLENNFTEKDSSSITKDLSIRQDSISPCKTSCFCFPREPTSGAYNQSTRGSYSPFNIERKLLAARESNSPLQKFWRSNKWLKFILFFSVVLVVVVLSAVYIY